MLKALINDDDDDDDDEDHNTTLHRYDPCCIRDGDITHTHKQRETERERDGEMSERTHTFV